MKWSWEGFDSALMILVLAALGSGLVLGVLFGLAAVVRYLFTGSL